MPKICFKYLLPLALLLCLLVSCRTQKDEPPFYERLRGVVPAKPALPYEQQVRYDELFAEAARQKQLEHYDAMFRLLREALRINPNASEALFELGRLQTERMAYSDSLLRREGDSLLARAVKLAPHNRYYKQIYGRHLVSTGRVAEALPLFEQVAAERPTPENYSRLVQLYEMRKDYPAAIRALNQIERLDGPSEEISLEKFRLYSETDNTELAYKSIEDLCAAFPLDLRYRVLLGDLYEQSGHHEMALNTYRDVLAAEPDNSYAQLSLLAYYKAAEADSLYMDLLQRVVFSPGTQTDTRVEALRGFAQDNLQNGGDTTVVVQLFDRVMQMPQDNRDVAMLYLSYMVTTGMAEQKQAELAWRILEIEPDYSPARFLLLGMAGSENYEETALKVCRDGQIYDPAEPAFYYFEAVTEYGLNKNKEAIAALRRGEPYVDESKDPETSSNYFALLGDILHEEGQAQEAFTAYDNALKYNSANLLCLNNYAYFLSLANLRLDDAEAMSKRTVDHEPNNATYLDTYAWILYQQKRYEQAYEIIERCIACADSTGTGDATLYEHAGDINYRAGRRTAANNYWRRASRHAKTPAERRRINQKVRRRRP